MRIEINGEPDFAGIPNDWGEGTRWDGTEAAAADNQAGICSISEIASIRTFAAQHIEFVVEGFIAAGTINLISGESGSGKTSLAAAICDAVNRGEPFAGFETQRRPVLVLDRENPLPVTVERFDRLHIQDGDNFKVWGGWSPTEPPAPFAPIIVNWVAACEPKPLIVVDSLVSFHGGDENDATETRAYMQGFRRLADLGATLIVLHHSGKGESSKEYRGSSDIKASVDVAYHLANIGGDASRLEVLRLKAFKARFTVQAETIFRCADGHFTVDGRSPSKTVSELLRDMLIANPGIQAKQFQDLARDKGLGRDRARVFLESGIKAGTVRTDRGSHNTRFHTWAEGEPIII